MDTLLLPEHIDLSFLQQLGSQKISIRTDARTRVQKNRAFLDQKIASGGIYYGINTGFGSLCNVKIAPEELSLLQENLVCSHACGMGDEVPQAIVRLMLLFKIHALCIGYSGVRINLIERLVDFYNLGITPVVYEQGSLGASGDLAPLAHLALPILGKGTVWYKNEKRNALEVLNETGLTPLPLAAKEGLALLNGTQFMSSYAAYSLLAAEKINNTADALAALSADVFLAKAEPYFTRIHQLRPHNGQIKTAEKICEWLKGSSLQNLQKEQVQDPYSFRCVPQVHGATKDTIAHAQKIIEIEINSVTDNPLVLHEEDKIVSGGNFHGQPLALQLDFMAIALAEIANISERRTYLLISGQRGLPPFLSPNPGVNSGLMIAQYTAASIVSQNKQLCTPASVDSIVSSNGQEDHVSMGANAATKLLKVVKNTQRVLGIELINAAQALHLRNGVTTSPALEKLIKSFQKIVPPINQDRVLHDDLIAAEKFVSETSIDTFLE